MSNYDLIVKPQEQGFQDIKFSVVDDAITAEGHAKNSEITDLCGRTEVRQESVGSGFVITAESVLVPEIKKRQLNDVYLSGVNVRVETDFKDLPDATIQDLTYTDNSDENELDIKSPNGEIRYEKFYRAQISFKPVGVEIESNQ